MPAHAVVIVGRPKSGKSRLLKLLLRQAETPRVLIVDTLLEHGDVAPARDLTDLYARADLNGGFRASVYPATEEELDWVCEFAASKKDISFAVDETAFWWPSAVHRLPDGILTIARTGRHFGQRLFLATQSPGAITKQVMDLSELWVLPLLGVRDAEYLFARTQGLVDAHELEQQRTPTSAVVARLTLEGRREDYRLDYSGPTLSKL